MHEINTALKFLEVGVKTKQKSYLLKGRRKIALYSVIVLVHSLSWALILFGAYKLFS